MPGSSVALCSWSVLHSKYFFQYEEETYNHCSSLASLSLSAFTLYVTLTGVLGKVGRIVAFDCFQPEHAIIIKDKDEVSSIYLIVFIVPRC